MTDLEVLEDAARGALTNTYAVQTESFAYARFLKEATPATVLSLIEQGRKAADMLWRARHVIDLYATNHPLIDEIDALFDQSPTE